MKIIPAVRSKKTVPLGEIEILLKDNVGTLLTSSRAIRTVKYGVKLFTSRFMGRNKENPKS